METRCKIMFIFEFFIILRTPQRKPITGPTSQSFAANKAARGNVYDRLG